MPLPIPMKSDPYPEFVLYNRYSCKIMEYAEDMLDAVRKLEAHKVLSPNIHLGIYRLVSA